jgi:hypothetical protein
MLTLLHLTITQRIEGWWSQLRRHKTGWWINALKVSVRVSTECKFGLRFGWHVCCVLCQELEWQGLYNSLNEIHQ